MLKININSGVIFVYNFYEYNPEHILMLKISNFTDLKIYSCAAIYSTFFEEKSILITSKT